MNGRNVAKDESQREQAKMPYEGDKEFNCGPLASTVERTRLRGTHQSKCEDAWFVVASAWRKR